MPAERLHRTMLQRLSKGDLGLREEVEDEPPRPVARRRPPVGLGAADRLARQKIDVARGVAGALRGAIAKARLALADPELDARERWFVARNAGYLAQDARRALDESREYLPMAPEVEPEWRDMDALVAPLEREIADVKVEARAAWSPHAAAAAGVAGHAQALPHLDAIQRSFGAVDVGDIRAHVGGAAAAAADALGAEAYAFGDAVAFASAPSLHTAAHEAAHVVQQRAGLSLPGGVGTDGDAHEQHADRVADAVVRGESAESLLRGVGGGGGSATVQRKSKKDRVAGIAREHERSVPMSAALVDELITGTAVIYKFVQRSMDAGMKADGMTYLYTSTEAMARGMAERWDRSAQDADGRPITLSDAEVLAAARAFARDSVGGTLIKTDNTIHINVKAEGVSFRTTLHEAMHMHVRLRGLQLGKHVNEGIAEYLSRLVFNAHNIPFEAYGPYKAPFELVVYLASVFGQDDFVRFAVQDGIEVLRKPFMAYATDAAKSWRKFVDACIDRRYDAARDVVHEYFVLNRTRLREDEDDADRSSAEFLDETQALESELERQTWPPEGRDPLHGTITDVTARGPSMSAVTVLRGGRDGVRVGWILSFEPSSELYPLEPFVTAVRHRMCDVIVAGDPEGLGFLRRQRVKLRKP